jgi:hypothetical protein
MQWFINLFVTVDI